MSKQLAYKYAGNGLTHHSMLLIGSTGTSETCVSPHTLHHTMPHAFMPTTMHIITQNPRKMGHYIVEKSLRQICVLP